MLDRTLFQASLWKLLHVLSLILSDAAAEDNKKAKENTIEVH